MLCTLRLGCYIHGTPSHSYFPSSSFTLRKDLPHVSVIFSGRYLAHAAGHFTEGRAELPPRSPRSVFNGEQGTPTLQAFLASSWSVVQAPPSAALTFPTWPTVKRIAKPFCAFLKNASFRPIPGITPSFSFLLLLCFFGKLGNVPRIPCKLYNVRV